MTLVLGGDVNQSQSGALVLCLGTAVTSPVAFLQPPSHIFLPAWLPLPAKLSIPDGGTKTRVGGGHNQQYNGVQGAWGGPWQGGEDAEVEGKVVQGRTREGRARLARKCHLMPDTIRTINGSPA